MPGARCGRSRTAHGTNGELSRKESSQCLALVGRLSSAAAAALWNPHCSHRANPPPQGPPRPPGAGTRVSPGSTGPRDGHDRRHYAWGQAGPFASAQARSRTLALPARARPAGAQRASQSVRSSGAGGSAAVSSNGSKGASGLGSGAARSAAVSSGTRPATTPSAGGRQGSVCGCAQGTSGPPPAPGAGDPPPFGDQSPAGDPDPAAQP